MTCDPIRQRLLASERPDKPASAEANHLAGCSSCRAWLRRVVQLEEMLPKIPIADPGPPEELLALFRTAGVKPVVPPPAQRLPSFRPKREGARQKLALALSLAATLSLFAITWWAVPHSKIAPSKATKNRVESKPRTPRERLNALVDQARDCLDQAKAHPEDAAGVAKQAARFRRLVEWDLQAEAKSTTPGERQIVLPGIANLLAHSRNEASELAAKWQGKHPDSARSMREMADAAEQAENRLRLLMAA
jgi:hypothetical protein